MFIHFLNDQILALHRLPQRFSHPELVGHVYRMLWAAVLAADAPLVIPVVDLVQSPVGLELIEPLAAISGRGVVEYVGSTSSVDELVQRKLVHFRGTGLHPEWQEDRVHAILQPVAPDLHPREQNTSEDMLTNWARDVQSLTTAPADPVRSRAAGWSHAATGSRAVSRYGESQLLQAFSFLDDRFRFPKLVDLASTLPDRLGDHAFLWNVVQRVDALRVPTGGPSARSFERALAHYWVASHVYEYGVPIIGRDARAGRIDCGLRHTDPDRVVDLESLHRFLSWLGIGFLLTPGSTDELIELVEFPYLSAAFQGVLLPRLREFERSPDRRVQAMRELGPLVARGSDLRHRVADPRRARLEALRIVADFGFGGRVLTRIPLPHWTSTGPPPAAPTRAATPPAAPVLAQLTAGPAAGLVGPDDPDRKDGMTPEAPTIFIGHGRSLLWLQLRDFIQDRLRLGWEEFNRVPVAGHTVIARLAQMLDRCDFAFLILTGEDEQRDGTLRARQNVIHELGLFQGRLGFDRAIILLEEGCEDFSNVAGLQQIMFPAGKIMAAAEEIRLVLEDRLGVGRLP